MSERQYRSANGEKSRKAEIETLPRGPEEKATPKR
jgi:hypothetical protein